MDNTPQDPNQILCSCGRLVRVIPAVRLSVPPFGDCEVSDNTFVVRGVCGQCSEEPKP